jgi:hypothetical protein
VDHAHPRNLAHRPGLLQFFHTSVLHTNSIISSYAYIASSTNGLDVSIAAFRLL